MAAFSTEEKKLHSREKNEHFTLKTISIKHPIYKKIDVFLPQQDLLRLT